MITTMFWDLGGVVLSNGWEKESRRHAAEVFGLDWEEFEDRHDLVVSDFETGRLSLDGYLDNTVFNLPRTFSREDFKEFMFGQSEANADSLAIVRQLSQSGLYLLAALNNEPLELNLYRIEKFGLRQYFTAFFSSCFLGVRKPFKGIFDTALNVTQRKPSECLFIDDRLLNLECSKYLGLGTIHYQNPEQLRQQLRRYGVTIA
jgi:putative hydrolase of the HAD superfamily